MVAEKVVEQAHVGLDQEEARGVLKYVDSIQERLYYGAVLRAGRSLLEDVNTHMGIYPKVSSLTFNPPWLRNDEKRSSRLVHRPHMETKRDDHAGLRHICPALYALHQDREASVSLWLVPDDHICVPASERRDDSHTMPKEQRGEHMQEQRNIRAPGMQGRAVRIALDFRLLNGLAIRQTGTLAIASISNTQEAFETTNLPSAWTVYWDQSHWFGDALLWVCFTKEVSNGCSGMGGAQKNPFVLLLWGWRGGRQEVAETVESTVLGDETRREAEWCIASMLCKKQHQWEDVWFTAEEKFAFGIGRTPNELIRASIVQPEGAA